MPRQLSVFNSISLDGYFTDGSADVNWAHAKDAEWQAFTRGNAGGDAEVIYGRKTYEMMASFWPTPVAKQRLPEVAASMNRMRKHVASRSLQRVEWENSQLIQGDLATEVRRLKSEPGPGLLIMGSGEIVSQLTQAGLVDAYQLVIVPVVLGKGRSLFEGVTARPRLTLEKTRSFANGHIVAWYTR